MFETMKKAFIVTFFALLTSSAFAQFNVGTSITGRTDMFGNTTTTHRDAYGNTIGTSITGRTDIATARKTRYASNPYHTKI